VKRPHALAAGLAAALAVACSGQGTPPPPPAGPVVLTDFAVGLGQVTDVAFLPDGRMLFTQKTGELMLRGGDGAVKQAARFAVDTESEKGLLGVVVDPAFATNGRLFLYYSQAGGTDDDKNRAVSIRLGADGVLVPGSEQVLVSGLHGPANHDGGALAIGPDGMLYVGVGDSGFNGPGPEDQSEPTNHFGTCLSNANGKILRVALDGRIPADNPLAGVAQATACGAPADPISGTGLAPPRREIWAWGFRNPWRFWFDPMTGRLWVGDVGEATFEEVDVAQAGKHHGWPWREGPHGFPVAKCREVVPDAGDCVDPVYHCRHGAASEGIDGDCQSITGGLIVDSPGWPEAERGRYVFGDNVNGRIYSVAVDAARTGVVAGSRRLLATAQGGPVSLRQGPDGDVYVAVIAGRVARLGPARSSGTAR
jgi:glucose/arabinose dehydrogenase